MTLDRISSNPKRMNGQPCIRDSRLTVGRVIELLATYPDRQELSREFPELEEEDIRQALMFAASRIMEDEGVDSFDTPDEVVLEGLCEGLAEALSGQTIPISEMWDGIDTE